ncbi:MAG: pyruvate synthase subunit PorB [Dehalococcoidales bacterium]|jgi:pyruvate ferredoxin oxidoreductase beta subunit|nr:pyruvate synthase subunit PorB [Dehalococcoidales bacterium]
MIDNNYVAFGKRHVTKEEYFAPGHRACIGCAEALAVRLAHKALGPNTIVVAATGCMEIVASQLPWTSWRIPWIHTLFENTAAVASGIEAGLKTLNGKGKRSDQPINVVATAGDGATSDIGLQSLSGALERRHNFLYICWDNEAYMNTGIQRSSATPYGASTTTAPAGKNSIGQVTWKKNLPAIIDAHEIPYIATACPSYPFDLMDKVAKGAAIDGPAYIHVFSVCPTGWRSTPETAIELGRLAVQTGVFPLYEIENGKYKMSVNTPRRRPVQDYLKLQGRFRHLSEDNVQIIQDRVDKEYAHITDMVARDKAPAAST